ncbi:MAG: ankyrin repeat domain-containing protein, partial [Treponema sp.]|nr:ankyrin repeat domain-containing protein [Treponema sp.]
MKVDGKNMPMGITPLMLAANETGSGDKIRQLFADGNGTDVNARDKNGQTALMYATFNDSSDAAEALLSAPGIDLEAKDITGSTALMKAVAYKAEGVCTLLAGAGADVNCTNYFGETALIRSIINKSAGITERLIQAGADVNRSDNTGRTPLIVAACHNDTDIVKRLINAGADTKLHDKSGNDVARAAAEKDSWEVLAFLINLKLISDKDIETALIKASMKGFANSTSTILALCKDKERLSYAAIVSASLKDKP